jgi:hypothetical protein
MNRKDQYTGVDRLLLSWQKRGDGELLEPEMLLIKMG